MINSETANSMIAGTVIATPEARLGWTANSSQPIVMMPKSGKIAYGNRVVVERDGKYYIKTRSKVELEVTKIGENKYEVVVGA